jgi:cytochrome c peroxidase
MGNKLSRPRPFLLIAAGLLTMALVTAFMLRPQPVWTESELKKLNSMALSSLPPVPPDPSNHVADNPLAAALGRDLFFDSRLSSTGYVSCATCHQPDKGFEDGLPLGQGVGLSRRRTPTLTGVAYATWLFWDGRKDSLWAQALEPLESPNEHGGNRLLYARTVAYQYAGPYEAVFGALPAVDWTKPWEALTPAEQDAVTLVFVNLAKAIEAYERTLTPAPNRFDVYAAEVSKNGNSIALNRDEVAGLRLFIGRADCVRCHHGPLFTDFEFHNTGVPPAAGKAPDMGWVTGLPLMLTDEFGCKGIWSDASPAGGCVDRRYLVEGLDNQVGAFKTPTLRGAAARGPYMHAGQFTTLAQVVQHYSTAPAAAVGTSIITPANLTDEEMQQLIAFLNTLE